jgi:hypothetical protein
VDQLPNAVLPLGLAVLAVEILADDDVGRRAGSTGFGISQFGLLEDRTSPFSPLISRPSGVPLDRVERVGDVGRAKPSRDAKPLRVGRAERGSECAEVRPAFTVAILKLLLVLEMSFRTRVYRGTLFSTDRAFHGST